MSNQRVPEFVRKIVRDPVIVWLRYRFTKVERLLTHEDLNARKLGAKVAQVIQENDFDTTKVDTAYRCQRELARQSRGWP